MPHDDSTELSMDELFGMTTEEVIAAHSAATVVYTGTYLTKVKNQYRKRVADTAEFDAGRAVINLAVDFYDQDNPTEHAGSAFIKTSPELRTTRSGQPDNASSRYAELAKALGLAGESAGAVYTAASQVMFRSRVREVYIVPEEDLHPSHADARVGTDGNAWITLQKEDEEERQHYLNLGLEPRIEVSRIGRVK